MSPSQASASADSLLVVFDDSSLPGSGALLWPITDLRAAFDIRTGALTTIERITRRLRRPDLLIVPPALAALTRERHPTIPVNESEVVSRAAGAFGSVVMLSGRAPLAWRFAAQLGDHECIRAQTAEDERPPAVVACRTDSARVARLIEALHAVDAPADPVQPLADFDIGAELTSIDPRPSNEAGAAQATGALAARVLSRPWHVRSLRDACLLEDLTLELRRLMGAHGGSGAARLPGSLATIGDHPWFVDPAAVIHPAVVFDVSSGPIWIDAGAVVRPGAVICGPCYVGAESTVLDRAIIRPNTSIGPKCKAAGEIGGTIFQGFSNKAHDGYLGDAFVGEWVNLGAGTTNSNLLNTYAEVIARPLTSPCGPAGSNEVTGEQFLGCVLGDHVKTAIGTRIMTGAIVGTGTMFAATPPLVGTVPALSWMTDAPEGGSGVAVRGYRIDKFEEVATLAMARRKVEPSVAYQERLQSLNSSANPPERSA